jgi:hypothetical protein
MEIYLGEFLTQRREGAKFANQQALYYGHQTVLFHTRKFNLRFVLRSLRRRAFA